MTDTSTDLTRHDWTRLLNPAQREAVEHVHGPLLVLAGAGSGKTRVLTTRIANLIEHHGVPPERIFAVTFTNKAAAEMKQRIGALLQRDPSGLWIGTFHSLSARLLRSDAPYLGFTRQFTIYDQDDSTSLVKRILDQKGHSPKLFPPRVVQSVISGAKNRMVGPEALAASAGQFDRPTQVAADVYATMQQELKKANAMDFDDLMLHPLALFKQHEERLRYWQERFRFLLVDEFQDTNRAQYELVRALGSHGNVCAVGDDDQSIYGWRGADVRNMRDFQTDFPQAALVRLEENYRSTQVVLDAANAVIAENQGRIGKTLRTTRRGGEAITLLAAADERDEAEWVARELEKRSAAGDWSFREMAVLYRTNSQSRAMEEAFRRAGVPYRLVGATSFYDRREVKDLLAYLRLVANPSDDEAFLRAVGVPRRGLGDTSLATLGRMAAQWGKPLLAAARTADTVTELRPNVREGFRTFATFIDTFSERAGRLAPAAVLEEIIKAIDYEAVLHAEGPEGAERWENVRELVASAANWSEVVAEAEDEATPLERFLAEAALLSGHDNIVGNEEGVTMMTLHTAKGLEWPVVVLAGMENGLFPLMRAQETPEGLEEERRLCYVGVTRAKDKLYMTWARSRRRGGELKPGMPSIFLRSLPPEVVDERRTTSLWSPSSAFGGEWGAGGRRSEWGGTAGRREGGRTSGAGAGSRAPARPGSAARGGKNFVESSRRPSAPEPEYEEASQDAPRFIKGERVRHRRFGSGTIQGLSGAGRDLKVSVAFDDEEVGTKQLLVAYAGLERDLEGA
ncbi:MAG TPA: UvrD-helicase domain-containing protein [Gemmatimonadales bacterium]|nr:UvrD-helicase domain-containing protein [Gemmatimonadales bacterium]